MRRDGRGARIAVAISCVAGLVVCGLFGPPVEATEPVGSVLLEASWADEIASDLDHRVLRLKILPLVPLDDWRLAVSAPLTFDVRALNPSADFRNAPADERRRTIRADMQRLGVGDGLTLEFEVLLPLQGGGTISFVASDAALEGRILDAVGITARAPAFPARRLGAVEFPAGQPR